MVEKTCLSCGQPYRVAQYRATKSKYCSHSCRAIGTMKMRSLPLEDRFWRKVKVKSENDCWLWTAATTNGGYGVIGHRDKTVRAHRLSYEMANGPIPRNHVVRHKCDNPACVNPDHLEIGTQADNICDAVSRNRNRGPTRKLTDSAVLDIRQSKDTIRECAERHKVSYAYVSLIRNGKARPVNVS